MDVGLVVVLAVLGGFLLVPLWFAWLSLDSRRWARVERVLGREPTGRQPPAWLVWVWAGLCPTYLGLGIHQLLTGDRSLGALTVVQGVLWGAIFTTNYLRWRRLRERESGSAGAEVEDGAEPGRPGTGVGGGH
jgi:hypothetical protein